MRRRPGYCVIRNEEYIMPPSHGTIIRCCPVLFVVVVTLALASVSLQQNIYFSHPYTSRKYGQITEDSLG